MLLGSLFVPRVMEYSRCRITEDYYLISPEDHHIHSTTLMPNIPFDYSKETFNIIDKSIFINSDETKLNFSNQIQIQNYVSTKYTGRYPYAFYGPKTKMGEEFELVCANGDPSYKSRYFRTQGNIINANSNDMYRYDRKLEE